MAKSPARWLARAGLTVAMAVALPGLAGRETRDPAPVARHGTPPDAETTASLPPAPAVAVAAASPRTDLAPEVSAYAPMEPATPVQPKPFEANPFDAKPFDAAGSTVLASLPPDRPVAPVTAQESAELGKIRAGVEAYRKGRLDEAEGLAKSLDDPVARTLLEWVAIRSLGGAAGFERINAFLKANPGYPTATAFRRQAEAALISDRRKPEIIRAFFEKREPISPVGRIALARALKNEGKPEEALALVRRSWTGDHLGAALEKIVLDEFGSQLTGAEHRLRAERYIFAGNSEAALRNAARVSADYAVLAKARLASGKAKGPLPAKQIEAVPASLRKDISFLFLQAQQARRSDKAAEAAKSLTGLPSDPALLGDGDGWWTERRLIARKLLDDGDAKTAYEVAAGNGAEDTAERIEAEWHAGWIALRFRQDAATAAKHFAEAAKLAETPISVARAAYWQGRASEALDKDDEAKGHYARAAEHPVAYYGQLARSRLGLPDLPLRRMTPAPISLVPGLRAARLLYAIEAPELAASMLIDLARTLDDVAALEAVADLARGQRDARTLLTIGKLSLQRGFPLDEAAFPTFGVPDFTVLGDPMERAIVHAIARQESAFDPAAVSHAGARGLMQMMPATARETARRANLPFELERLTSDPHYSARMGAAHLNDLISEWRGSYVLTFAAYNAGSGNVRKWVAAYGDPRNPQTDVVDWVERIPFSETRNYVQRVMENLQVYRQRLNQRTAYLIDYDLKRSWGRD